MSLREELVTQEEVMFSMRIPKQLHKEFRMKAFTDDVNMKDILIDAIRKYIGKI